MSSWRLAMAGALAALAAAAFACSGSSSGIGTGCSGLSACCATLSGAEAQSCLTTVETTGVTDAVCNAVLSGFQSDGICGGGGGGSGATGCAALGSCCPDLPVSQDPMACLTVVNEGTDEACAQSLSAYQAAGYCEPDAGALGTPGSSVLCMQAEEGQCIVYPGLTLADAMSSCTELGGEVVSSCPTARLLGCCVLPPLPPGYIRALSSTCYYSVDSGLFNSGSMEQSDCSSAMGTWSSSVPSGL